MQSILVCPSLLVFVLVALLLREDILSETDDDDDAVRWNPRIVARRRSATLILCLRVKRITSGIA